MIDRRKFHSGLGAGLAGMLASGKAAYGRVPRKFKLRVLGTHVTLQEEIRQQAEKDLGIDIEFDLGGNSVVLHKASTRPDSFDLYELWLDSIKVVWQAGTIQPIDSRRIDCWDDVNPLTKRSRLLPDALLSKGDSPSQLMEWQADGTLGPLKPHETLFVPYVHNVDGFGYNPSVVPRGVPYETESWRWLFDERWQGRVAVANSPTIGLFDMVLATQAVGLVSYKDIGHLTVPELNALFAVLVDYRQRGHFRGAWTSVPQSAEWMIRGDMVIGSMFSPGVATIKGAGTPCVYAAPKEGYRAWQGALCLSKSASDRGKDAAYAYMNWWLSGWPGAYVARQGYYISNPHQSQPLMTPAEWDYWYAGRPAAEDLRGTNGKISVKRGEVRSGGSYRQRMSRVAVWNTVMDTYEYSLRRWKEFLLA